MKMNINKYLDEFKSVFEDIKKQYNKLDEIVDIIKQSEKIYIAGNGASALISSHLALHLRQLGYDAISLTDNVGLVTAEANDDEYKNIFMNQLYSTSDRGDILIIFSGSGNSENVVTGAKYMIDIGEKVIAFVGTDGGELSMMEDVECFHVNGDMQHAEDAFSIICHLLLRCLDE